MKLIILDIVAITAFLDYAQRPSLVSAASAVPLPALTASSTPIVAPVERRLRPSVVPGNEAAKSLADRAGQLFHGGASRAVGATFNVLARSHEKFRDVTVLRHYKVFDRQLADK
uniref:RxLR effector candidate protein n=1 Tax=Peronospora matthiolae TaxID=2874970 RepID=A0AAV1VKR8_9STRA